MVLMNSFRYPSSNIRHEQRNIRAVLDKKDFGLGTLFISESLLCWQEKDDIGFCIPYSDITLHAISKDENVYPKECIYIMLDGRLNMPGDEPQNTEDDNSGSDEESESNCSELILIPNEENADTISGIYEAIKVCQELNPDPEDMEEDDDNLYADAEDEFYEEEEGHYVIQERGAAIDELSTRMENNSVDVNYVQNGNDEDEFQDAD
ncbi:hypothetical protein ABEB36_001537 [Hypothenemus hampei]|uniref:Methylosome subunit pICln n=1 Tax=Hypothenemus hampei TaxID=57062 RepID=A0ABD1FEV6_HYPHA